MEKIPCLRSIYTTSMMMSQGPEGDECPLKNNILSVAVYKFSLREVVAE